MSVEIAPEPIESQRLWSTLLKETSQKCTLKLPQNKGLIVLGDCETGKTSLLNRLQGVEDLNKCYGLEYSFIDVKDEYRDDEAVLSCYVPDGETVFMNLLKPFVDENNIFDHVAVLVVSMSQPWSIMEQLEKWVAELQKFIDSLEIPPEQLHEAKNMLVKQFCEYVEDEDSVHAGGVPLTPKGPSLRRNTFNPATAALMGGSELKRDYEVQQSATPVEEAPKLPLTEGALVNNLGIPLMVIVTKSDQMDMLEKDHNLNDEHFDFIQMHIRRFCLSYGASLVYSSVKSDKNCALLKRYLTHEIYGFPFGQTAYVVERDCIFVPSGWDTLKKISILEQNLVKIRPGDEYNELIQNPKPNKSTKDPEPGPQDEQEFLAKMLSTMQKDSLHTGSVPISTDNSDVYGSSSGRQSSPYNRNQQIRAKGPQGVANIPGGPAGAANPTEGVLANFFNSLLSKRSPGSGPLGAMEGMDAQDMHTKLEKMSGQMKGDEEEAEPSEETQADPFTKPVENTTGEEVDC